jgi:hypothetical protein
MSLFMKRSSGALYPPRIACYVCGSEVPSDYPLYPEPPVGIESLLQSITPHFPFLVRPLLNFYDVCNIRNLFFSLQNVARHLVSTDAASSGLFSSKRNL